MSVIKFVARVHNAVRAILNPTATVVECELTEDQATRDPVERIPTKRQYEKSRNAAVGLEIRVRRTGGKRARFSRQLRSSTAAADVAVKRLVDFAASPKVVEVRERAAKLRDNHPLHEERVAFRGVRVQKPVRLAIEAVVIIADWGVWFTLLMIGMSLTFTRMASTTDPTKVYNPEWFIAHPAEWVTAFVVPTFAALVTLVVGKLSARRWAQRAAQLDHPERATELAAEILPRELRIWVVALAALSVGLYFVAVATFSQSADELGWVIAAPWAVIPLAVFLVERYGHDPIAEVDAIILIPAANVEAQKEQLTTALMQAEDAWRQVWTSYDVLIREIIDGASGDLNLWEQIYMRADANSGNGNPFAPISAGVQPVVGRTITAPVSEGETPARAVPVVLEAQRGLVTEVAPWITKQIEQDIQILAECRPPIDGGDERSARVTDLFETVYAAAVAKTAARAADAADTVPVETVPVETASVETDALETDEWDPSGLLDDAAVRQ